MWPFKRKLADDEKLFSNTEPLLLPDYNWDRLTGLDFAAFPIVEDFSIRLKQTGTFGLHLYFYSPTLGRLASFPWWDNVENDLPKYSTKDIPVGDLEEPIEPFFDAEQGWQILIFEREDYVYVMQSDECWTLYPVWFRVDRDHYYAKWMNVIRQFNPEP